MIIVKGPVYFAPVGADPEDDTVWKPLGTLAEDVELVSSGEQDLFAELAEAMSKPLGPVTVTTTFKLPTNQLERRFYLRLLFGVESGSLIHNGKKRRKS